MKAIVTPALGPRVLLLALVSCSSSFATSGHDGGSDAGDAGDAGVITIPAGDGAASDASSSDASSSDASSGDASSTDAGCSPPTTLACGGQCVDPSGPAHCGACDNECPAPAAGTGNATCMDGACGVTCNAGYAVYGSDCLVTDLYVDVATGSNGNPGTLSAPLKTITHALALAQGSMTVHVFAGTYSEGSASGPGLGIVDAVTVESYGTGTVIVAGPAALDAGYSYGFSIADSGTLRGVTIQGYDEPIAVSGSGSALLDSVNTVNNTSYISLTGTGTLTAVDSQLGPVGVAGVVGSTATFVMQSGTLAGTGTCAPGEGLPPLQMWGGSAVLTGVTVDVSGPGEMWTSGSLAMTSATITGPTCEGQPAILIGQGGAVELTDTSVPGGINNAGILTMHGGSIAGTDNPAVACSSSTTGELPALVMRDVTVTVPAGGPGLLLEGPGAYDLGTSYSPGGNTFSTGGNAFSATRGAIAATSAGITLTASGNTWIAGVQGANASGQMVAGTSVTGPLACPVNTACNFNLAGATDSITF